MGTGYHIRAGYNSAHSQTEVEEALRSIVLEICDVPEDILDDARLVDGLDIPEWYIDGYRLPWKDLTIKFVETKGRFEVLQMATGGGESRMFKESLRRAMCRIVLERMHERQMEISITVV